ncbi:MAG: hypothetical protein ACJ75B_16985 [Flavisolibacter sp.]
MKSNNFEIETGDRVRHKEVLLNGGLAMNVTDTTDTQAQIEYFDNEGVNKQTWVDKTDLEIIHKVDGGFRKEGE